MTAAHVARWTRWYLPARSAVVLGGVYVYVLLVIDPRLLLHSQSPAFFLRWPEVETASAWPGGLLEYLAAGLSQACASAWLGAGVIAINIGLIWSLSHLLLTHLRGRPLAAWLSFVPVILLLILLNGYTLPLASVISLAVCLLLAWGYVRLRFGYGLVRTLMGLGLCVAVYGVAGGVGVLLACLCGLIELLNRRAVAPAVMILLGGAAIPYLAATQVYQFSPQDAYLRLTALDYDFSPPVAASILYLCLPLSMILVKIWPARRAEPGLRNGRRSRVTRSAAETGLARALPALCFLLASVLAVRLSYDSRRHAVLATDYHVRQRKWDGVLQAAEPLRWSGAVPGRRTDERLASTPFGFHFPVGAAAAPAPLLPTWNVGIHNINLALAKKGQLLDRMFEYPQRMGASVVRLLPDDDGAYVAHSYNPDVLLELGHVNEAERVACESLANVGPRPWLLERLILINVLKDRPQAVRTCLNLMACDASRRARCETLQRELERDPALSGHAGLRQIRSRMYRVDHVGNIGDMDPDEEMLRYLLVANPHNRLAFDYLTAHYLLTLRDDKVAENMRHLAAFGYTRLPRHCEESLLLRARLTGNAADVRRLPIRPETIRRFEEFQRDLNELGGPGGPKNLQVRDAMVAGYADTYWFYALFGDTFFRPERKSPTSRPGEES